jgi:hypothetical protein
MKMTTAYALSFLVLACASRDASFAQSTAVQNGSLDLNSSALGVTNYLILTPNLAAARILPEGVAYIPFSVKSNSDKVIAIMWPDCEMEGLAFLNEAGQADWIENFPLPPGSPSMAVRPVIEVWTGSQIMLKPGETRSIRAPTYDADLLHRLNDTKVFGVIEGYFNGTQKRFTCYSAPFAIPPAIGNPPWDDLGVRDYLSVTPAFSEVYFGGGDFASEPGEIQRKEPDYTDRIKNGSAEYIFLPITLKNMSDRKLVIGINLRYYIVGNMTTKNDAMKQQPWFLLKLSAPILAPGESASTETVAHDYIEIKHLQNIGYKPGDQIVAVVEGRIADTNKVFECCSAPFTLPPMPKATQ